MKLVFTMNSPDQCGDGINLPQNYRMGHTPPTWSAARARSERPPSGPEKHAAVVGNDMSKEKIVFLSFNKMRFFESFRDVNNFRVA